MVTIFFWAGIALVTVALIFWVTGHFMQDSDYSDSCYMTTATLGVVGLAILVILGIYTSTTSPDEDQACADAGNMWYSPDRGASVCYTPEQFKIITEIDSD